MNSVLRRILRPGEDLLNVILPRVCPVCANTLVPGEEVMCLGCLVNLPRVTIEDTSDNVVVRKLLSLKAPIERGASMYFYQKENPFARLIHDTKYRNRPNIGRGLARMFAEELEQKRFFDGMDAIMPIPIHFLRYMSRGYNQSAEIARGIKDVCGLPLINNLKARYHTSQTRKNAAGRRLNAHNTFYVKREEELDNLHILIVDDVITTGSTILSAIETLKSVNPTVRLSVFLLTLTHLS